MLRIRKEERKEGMKGRWFVPHWPSYFFVSSSRLAKPYLEDVEAIFQTSISGIISEVTKCVQEEICCPSLLFLLAKDLCIAI